jgi:hypothetical protein
LQTRRDPPQPLVRLLQILRPLAVLLNDPLHPRCEQAQVGGLRFGRYSLQNRMQRF